MKKSKAFTVLETIVTLAVICLIITIGTIQLSNLRSKIILQSSVSEFKTALSGASRVAIIKQQPVKIRYFSRAHMMEFISEDYHRKVVFDEELSIKQFTNYQISSNGMLSPKHIIFSNGKNTQEVNIQMAWGRVLDEE